MKNLIISGVMLLVISVFSHKALAEEAVLFEIKEYKGKIVYLDFWASWCIPCRKSFPWMNKIRSLYDSDDLVIIAVNLDKKRSLADDFLKENPAKFKIIYDPKGKLAKRFQIKGMPSSIIFDRNGKPVVAHTGFFTKKIGEYEQELQTRIDEK